MFQAVQNWLDRHCSPIGIDFGSDCLRVAQVELRGGDATLIAAASVDVPLPIRDDPAERLSFLRDALPQLMASDPFRGRRAVVALPAASSFIQQFVCPLLPAAELQAAVQVAARRVIPADADELLIRHQAVHALPDDQCEVIAVGADRRSIVQMLTAIHDAGIDVVAMNTEPGALADCYMHLYRRHGERNSTAAIIDLGCSGTRVTIIRDRQLVAAHGGLIGGRHLTQAVADAMDVDLPSARMLRLKYSRANSTAVSDREQHVVFVAPTRGTPQVTHPEHAMIQLALQPVTESLCQSLAAVKNVFEAAVNGSPIQRIVFVGGESRDRGLCEHLARYLGITAVVGDPLLRMGKDSSVCVNSGIDRRQPQPAWAIAIGLSLGPAGTSVPTIDDELGITSIAPITPGRM